MLARCVVVLAAGVLLAGCDASPAARGKQASEPSPAPKTVQPPPKPAAVVAPAPVQQAKRAPASSQSAPDTLSEKLIANYDELAKLLAFVHDDGSSRRVTPRVAAIMRQQDQLRRKVANLAGSLPADDDARLQNRYGDGIRAATARVRVQVQRIKNLGVGDDVLGAIAAPESTGNPQQ